MYFKMIPVPFPQPEASGDFSPYLLWEYGRAAGDISHDTSGISLEFLTFRIVHTEPPATCQLQFRFYFSITCSHGGFHSSVSAQVSYDSLCSPGSPILVAVICPVSSLLFWIQKSRWFFNFFFFSIECSVNFQAPYSWNWKPNF